ncbi:transmembrane protein 125 [Lates japonicus]|uniref:Transmembrane protein 125 n=1 Tax=Lates japonicus TaxID=270547 RepID=A0AAD3M9J3_LATJO|nr:transmembrane protein 125 [Lates japonicus]
MNADPAQIQHSILEEQAVAGGVDFSTTTSVSSEWRLGEASASACSRLGVLSNNCSASCAGHELCEEPTADRHAKVAAALWTSVVLITGLSLLTVEVHYVWPWLTTCQARQALNDMYILEWFCWLRGGCSCGC